MSYDVYSKKDVLSDDFDIRKNTSHRWSISSNRKSFIYFLCNKDHEIVYIGQSFYDPSIRVFTHKKEGKKEFSYYRAIQLFKCPTEELNNIEAELILRHNPIYNKVLPRNDTWARGKVLFRSIEIGKWQFNRILKDKTLPEILKKSFNKNTYYSIPQLKAIVKGRVEKIDEKKLLQFGFKKDKSEDSISLVKFGYHFQIYSTNLSELHFNKIDSTSFFRSTKGNMCSSYEMIGFIESLKGK